MKRTAKILGILLMLALLVSSLISCREPEDPVTLWDSATYKEDVTLGGGAKTINVTVVVGENTVVFTLKTDKDTVADALLEHSLVVGEVSEQFGLTLTASTVWLPISRWTVHIGHSTSTVSTHSRAYRLLK